jgi:integration host factor subunit beta
MMPDSDEPLTRYKRPPVVRRRVGGSSAPAGGACLTDEDPSDGGSCVQRAAVSTEPALTKSDLIAELAASHPHLRVADVELIVATVFDQITDALARGGRVELRSFGAFTVKQRRAHIGQNPRTGETVQVREKAAPYFRTGKELRDLLNRGGMKRRT